MRLSLLLLSLVIAMGGVSQLEYSQWYFGSGVHLDFSAPTPVVSCESPLFSLEGTASISDESGNLLFFSDGMSVWDANENLMPNGSGLHGSWSSAQSVLIVPHPHDKNLYILFTTGAPYLDNTPYFIPYFGLNYSIVDMSANGGLGDVVTANIHLLDSVSEKLTAIRHCNGTDLWVVTHGTMSNEFYSYPVTRTGVGAPVVTNSGPSHSGGHNSLGDEVIGCMTASPDGGNLALAVSPLNRVELYDFDNLTGKVSNPRIDSTSSPLEPRQPYDLSFSPTGSYLYVAYSNPVGIFQFDPSASSSFLLTASRTRIAYQFNEKISGMELAPDGRIYVAHTISNYLGIISFPEQSGVGCGYIEKALSTDTCWVQLGLPNFSYAILGSGRQSPEMTEIPNVFTPNGDGINEAIDFSAFAYSGFSIKIYNRWGNLVFETTDPHEPWRGSNMGQKLASGTYYYLLSYDRGCSKLFTQKGFIQLNR